jgi:hypothetical protein
MSGELAKLRQRVDDNQPTTLREPLERLLGLRTVRAFAANVQFATCG